MEIMPMRQDCLHFESRTYPNGETVRKCDLDLAPEAPWRCPENCTAFTKRRVDVAWEYGTLVTPKTPDEPVGEGIAELLDAAEDIINEAGPRVMAEVHDDRRKQAKKEAGVVGRVRSRFRRKK
jgi:hypothetical protein